MRINERFDQLEEKIHRLEKEVEALKAGQQTVTLESEPIGKVAPEKKAAGSAAARAKKSTSK